jgi:hypothetical protein
MGTVNELNIDILCHAKTEYTKQLTNILVPHLYDGINSLFATAVHEYSDNYLREFQNSLRNIPKWNQNIIDEETTRIILKSKCDWLDDLITAVFVSNTKILTAIRVVNNDNKINLTIPKNNNFIHKCYIETAREIYKNPYLFDNNITGIDKQRNMRESLQIIEQAIIEAVRKNLPVQQILNQYLGKANKDDDDVSQYSSQDHIDTIKEFAKHDIGQSVECTDLDHQNKQITFKNTTYNTVEVETVHSDDSDNDELTTQDTNQLIDNTVIKQDEILKKVDDNEEDIVDEIVDDNEEDIVDEIVDDNEEDIVENTNNEIVEEDDEIEVENTNNEIVEEDNEIVEEDDEIEVENTNNEIVEEDDEIEVENTNNEIVEVDDVDDEIAEDNEISDDDDIELNFRNSNINNTELIHADFDECDIVTDEPPSNIKQTREEVINSFIPRKPTFTSVSKVDTSVNTLNTMTQEQVDKMIQEKVQQQMDANLNKQSTQVHKDIVLQSEVPSVQQTVSTVVQKQHINQVPSEIIQPIEQSSMQQKKKHRIRKIILKKRPIKSSDVSNFNFFSDAPVE